MMYKKPILNVKIAKLKHEKRYTTQTLILRKSEQLY